MKYIFLFISFALTLAFLIRLVILKNRAEKIALEKKRQIDEAEYLLRDFVEIDGAHHKQYGLHQIAKALKIELDNEDKGIAP